MEGLCFLFVYRYLPQVRDRYGVVVMRTHPTSGVVEEKISSETVGVVSDEGRLEFAVSEVAEYLMSTARDKAKKKDSKRQSKKKPANVFTWPDK